MNGIESIHDTANNIIHNLENMNIDSINLNYFENKTIKKKLFNDFNEVKENENEDVRLKELFKSSTNLKFFKSYIDRFVKSNENFFKILEVGLKMKENLPNDKIEEYDEIEKKLNISMRSHLMKVREENFGSILEMYNKRKYPIDNMTRDKMYSRFETKGSKARNELGDLISPNLFKKVRTRVGYNFNFNSE